MRTIPIAITVAVAMLAIPAGSAAWSYAGSSEPDNKEDSQAWIWASQPFDAKKRIYFNGYTVVAAGLVGHGVNVNVAAIESHMQPVGLESYNAILGNWVDCNADGYIGFGEAGLREYDATLLTDPSICPPSTGDVDVWDGSHNYNGWVTELIPVGTDGGQPSAAAGNQPEPEDNEFDQRVIRDTSARVWGDYGRPDDLGGGFGTCPIRPFPRGTVQSTGGLLDYTDCHSGRAGIPGQAGGLLESWNFVMDSAGDPAGLRFADDDNGHSGALGGIGTLGSEDSENAVLVMSDCTEPVIFDSWATSNETSEALGDPAREDMDFIQETAGFTIREPQPPTTRDTTDPTVPGQVNQTTEEGEDCDTSNDDGHDTYGTVESDFEGNVATDKRQARFNMEFEDNGILNNTPRGSVSDGFGILETTREEFGVSGDFPVRNGKAGASLGNERITHDWFARVALVKSTLPGTRQALGPGVDPSAAAEYVTYYAFVSSATTSKGYLLPGGGATAQYGFVQCGGVFGPGTGAPNGWNCDPALWNLNADGTPQPSVQGGMAVPGLAYNLRDVDCEDGSNNLGVPLGFGALGVAPCVPFS